MVGLNEDKYFGDYIPPKAELQKCPTCGSNVLIDGVCQHCHSELKSPANPEKFAKGSRIWNMVRLALETDLALGEQEAKLEHPRPHIVERNITCSRCGKAMPSEAKFCPDCGLKVEVSHKTCSNCGNSTSGSARFCPSCGTPV